MGWELETGELVEECLERLRGRPEHLLVALLQLAAQLGRGVDLRLLESPLGPIGIPHARLAPGLVAIPVPLVPTELRYGLCEPTPVTELLSFTNQDSWQSAARCHEP